MPALETLQVFQALNRSPNARLEHSAELGDGMAAALWSNHHDAQDYEAPSHHTLSCYIAGGTGTFRRDQPGTKGGPDKLCILPAEHQSGWVINGDIRLAHLYFSPEQFALGCVTLLDREPRELQLREATFLDDPAQARRFRQMLTLNWDEPGERVLTSSLAHEMLSHVLLGQVGMREGLRLKGGLAAHQRRQLVEFIDNSVGRGHQPGAVGGVVCAVGISLCADVSRELWVAAASVCVGAATEPGAGVVAFDVAAVGGDCVGVRVCQCESFHQSVSSGIGWNAWRVSAGVFAVILKSSVSGTPPSRAGSLPHLECIPLWERACSR